MQVKFADNIFLTGFMGSGKTTAGQKLAKLLKRNFIDLDQYIEQKEKMTIQSLFENFGEASFRKIEQKYLLELINTQKDTVIALGGGTVCYEDNIEKIKDSGCLIFIEMPAAALAQRLERSKINRPLLKNLKGNELISFISQKLSERQTYYDRANIKVPGLNLTPQILYQLVSEYKK